jgi:formate hydrogenlyase subunit 3/multisubunit Na+/H+ antiporter MnhD subunit
MIEFIFEVLLQLVFEIVEAVFSSGVKRSRQTRLPLWLSAIVYTGLGVFAGFVSVWMFPQAFLHGSIARIANLLLTPVLMGFLAGAFAAWRGGDQQGIFLNRFACAYLFALSMAIVRFFVTQHA